MVQIFDAPESMGQSLAQGLGKFLGQQQQQQQPQQQQEQQGQLANLLFGQEQGSQFAGLPIEAQLKAAQIQAQAANQQALQQQKMQESSQKQQTEQTKEQQKIQEKVIPIQHGLETIQRMRQIGEGKRLGRGSAIIGAFGGKTAEDRGEYEQLGKSLISLSTNIPIRNRIEFETLAEKLYDPSLPDKERQGILKAMERILTGSLAQYAGPQNVDQYIPKAQTQQPNERPPLDSFYRK